MNIGRCSTAAHARVEDAIAGRIFELVAKTRQHRARWFT
jgi:hypothetical protein